MNDHQHASAIPMPAPPNVGNSLVHSPNVQNSNSASLQGNTAAATTEAAAFRPTSVINLTNSNDVVIGPMTQYQGAVTIYQYMDATVENSRTRVQPNIGMMTFVYRRRSEATRAQSTLRANDQLARDRTMAIDMKAKLMFK